VSARARRISGARLRDLRERAGLSRAALARRVRASESSIARWERMDPLAPRSRVLKADVFLRLLHQFEKALGRDLDLNEVVVSVPA